VRKRVVLCCAVLTALTLAACGGGPDPTPTPNVRRSPTPSETITPTLPPDITPTATPSSTPVIAQRLTLPPSWTPTATPTATLTPTVTQTPTITLTPSATSTLTDAEFCEAGFSATFLLFDAEPYRRSDQVQYYVDIPDPDVTVVFEAVGQDNEATLRREFPGGMTYFSLLSLAELPPGTYEWTTSVIRGDESGLCEQSGTFAIRSDTLFDQLREAAPTPTP
jgi:hypothetical protein